MINICSDEGKFKINKPFHKWVGGKSRIMPTLLKHLPPEGDILIEPFAGGGSIFMNTNYKKYIINDSNVDLINTYRFLCENTEEFIDDAKSLFFDENNRLGSYMRLKAEFNNCKEEWRRAVLFIYLVRHGFNGLFRVNRRGGFNVPFGKFKTVYFPEQEMRAYAEKASSVEVEFHSSSYQDVMATYFDMKTPAIVYLDPPYTPDTDGKGFSSYQSGGFSLHDQTLLHQYAVLMSRNGHRVYMSNSDVEFNRALYQDQQIVSLEAHRSISRAKETRGKVGELVVIY